MLADYHVHTEFSDDSVYPMEQVVRDAIGMGMEEICFTDHVDYPRYFAEIRKLRQKYSDAYHSEVRGAVWEISAGFCHPVHTSGGG